MTITFKRNRHGICSVIHKIHDLSSGAFSWRPEGGGSADYLHYYLFATWSDRVVELKTSLVPQDGLLNLTCAPDGLTTISGYG